MRGAPVLNRRRRDAHKCVAADEEVVVQDLPGLRNDPVQHVVLDQDFRFPVIREQRITGGGGQGGMQVRAHERPRARRLLRRRRSRCAGRREIPRWRQYSASSMYPFSKGVSALFRFESLILPPLHQIRTNPSVMPARCAKRGTRNRGPTPSWYRSLRGGFRVPCHKVGPGAPPGLTELVRDGLGIGSGRLGMGVGQPERQRRQLLIEAWGKRAAFLPACELCPRQDVWRWAVRAPDWPEVSSSGRLAMAGSFPAAKCARMV